MLKGANMESDGPKDDKKNKQENTDANNSGNRASRIIVSLDNFKICRNNVSVDQDKNYLQERTKDFSKKGYLAKALERIASNGFEDGGWLGNIPNKIGQTPFDVTPVYSACLVDNEEITYDDVVNRIDYAVMIQPRKDEEQSIVLGFDVTTNSDNDTIIDKLQRSSNDEQKELPFGFSGLDYPYFPDGQMLSENPLVPRYCIALDIDETYVKNYDYAQHKSHLQPTDEKSKIIIEEQKRQLKKKNDEARFLVLSEIYEQNELYLSMLPEKDGIHNKTIETAEDQLKQIKEIVWSALQRASFECPLDISISGSLDPKERTEDDQKILRSKKQRKEINDKIKQLFKEPNPEKDKNDEEIGFLKLERYKLVKECIKRKNDSYAALVTIVENIKTQSEAGKIDSLKQVKPRNKK